MDTSLCQHDCACERWRILFVSLVKIDDMISPFRFDFVSIKSIPYRAVGASLFWCCCCYSRCCFRVCVIIFVRFSFCLSHLSFVVACLCGGRVRIVYVFICLVATLRDRTLSWVRFDWFLLITGITRTSFVVVPRKLLSSFVPPRCCSFFLFRSMPSTCVVAFADLLAFSC